MAENRFDSRVLRGVSDRSLPEEMRRLRSDNALLRKLKRDFDLKNIFYPGCWDDEYSLRPIFSGNQIVYMDNDNDLIRYRHRRKMRMVVIGEMKEPPFRDETFEAMFYQDAHVNRLETFESSIKVVRKGGIVIFSSDDCGSKTGIQPVDLLSGMKSRLQLLNVHSNNYLPFIRIR